MELLISEIQKRNVLWNKWNKKYRDRLISDREWDEVAKNTKMDKEEAKKKWRNLRDTFLREKKKVKKCRSGDPQERAEIYTGKWSYYNLLLFLKDTTTPRVSDGNITDEEVTENYEDNHIIDQINNDDSYITDTGVSNPYTIDIVNNYVSTPEIETEISQSTQFIHTHETSTLSTPVTNQSSDSEHLLSRKRKKPKVDDDKYLENLLKIESQKVALLQQFTNVTAPEIDEDMLFFQSLLPYLKKMDSIQKLRVRNQFQNILINELSQNQESSLNVALSYLS
ncbi:uncharacterized protein LOC111028264 [Myzus persicae]|uniref:uncharacterized protein LOC111028264 n=1 Tax=Myzus persicae TaxID=13164 RepID=UPI000B933D4F|nr:uncharacterized protein LOC111028264 [Myzus persicae]